MTTRSGSKCDAAARYRAFSDDEAVQRVVHARLSNDGEPVDSDEILEFVRKTGEEDAKHIRETFDT